MIALLLASVALPLGGGDAWAAGKAKAKVKAQPIASQQLQAKRAKTASGKPTAKPQVHVPMPFDKPGVKPRPGAAALAGLVTAAGATEVAALHPGLLMSRQLAGAGLPLILNEADIARYRVIFQLQESADWAGADDIIAKLRDRGLMGYVLADRYLHPQYRTSYQELKAWLDEYHDHPDAQRLHKLALKRKPKGAKSPRPPSVANVPPARTIGIDVRVYDRQAYDAKVYAPRRKLNAAEKREYDKLIKKLDWTIRKGTQASFRKLMLEDRTRVLLHPGEYDGQLTRLAQGYYAVGDDQHAYFWAEQAAKRSGEYIPEANWTAGLAAWRMGKLDVAARHFESVARSEYSSRWLISAGAFWAARAHVRLRHYADYNRLLAVAAENPRTFYGLLARRLQNKENTFVWSHTPIDKAALKELSETPGGRRAVMLLQIGDELRAERELRAIDPKSDPGLVEAMLALADRANMPSLAMRLGNMLVRAGAPITDATAYPAPLLESAAGEVVDRELVLALVRQESGFNPNARSPAGARGLMQIMPGTASFIAREGNFGGQVHQRLYEPEINVMLGQRYIDILLKDPSVNGDLFKLMTAWNAGPGNLAKWMKSVKHQDDSLLFIESIPSKETRNFVERTLANYWVYRQRFDLRVNSLDAVAAGKWPTYHSDKSDQVEIAEDERRRK